MVLETNLHYFVGESEHDGMFGPHPLLDVNYALRLPRIIIRACGVIFHLNVTLNVCRLSASRTISSVRGVLRTVFEVRPEMLQ